MNVIILPLMHVNNQTIANKQSNIKNQHHGLFFIQGIKLPYEKVQPWTSQQNLVCTPLYDTF